MHSLLLRSGELCSISLRGGYLGKLLFCKGDLALVLHLLIYSIIYLDPCGLMIFILYLGL